MQGNDLLCPECGREARTGAVYPFTCICGGLWTANPEADAFPASGFHPTPLWRDPRYPSIWWKREDLNPTGSFKDRGAVVLAALAAECGAEQMVVDSSGSAALAAAAAAARVRIPLTVHTPRSLAPPKRDALRFLGATLVSAGDRSDAAERAREESRGAFYASHVYHPAFSTGTGGAATEVLDRMGEAVPPVWVVPVGNGSLFLGLARVLETVVPKPRLIAVQAARCPGLRKPGRAEATEAVGIAISDPPRRTEILAAVERFSGRVLEIPEDALLQARETLWGRGVAAETASAASLAGIRVLEEEGETGPFLGWITGSGLRQ